MSTVLQIDTNLFLTQSKHILVMLFSFFLTTQDSNLEYKNKLLINLFEFSKYFLFELTCPNKHKNYIILLEISKCEYSYAGPICTNKGYTSNI